MLRVEVAGCRQDTCLCDVAGFLPSHVEGTVAQEVHMYKR